MPAGPGTYGGERGRPKKETRGRKKKQAPPGDVDAEIANLMKASDRVERKEKRAKQSKQIKVGKKYKFTYRNKPMEGKIVSIVNDRQGRPRQAKFDIGGSMLDVKIERIML